MNIIIKGLDTFEKKILQTTIKLYEKRETNFVVLADSEMARADVVVVDSRDAEALSWAERHDNELQQHMVVWIDGESSNPRHAGLNRPVLWVNLPIILARILDEIGVKEAIGSDKAARKAVFADKPQTQPKVDDNRKVVLVVDDSLAIRNYLTALLEADGYAVRTADDGEEALECFDQGGGFACVFMDVLMPGMDGYTACRKIKAMRNGKHVPVLMLTGKGSPFDRIRGRMAGCSAYLTKPVNVGKLQQALEKYA